jgi:ADP-ribosylglycohydrolase
LADWLAVEPEQFFRARYSGALVTESLPAVVFAFLWAPEDPVDVVRTAVELARDADTIGAMAGTIVGAYQGRVGCPRPAGPDRR